MCPKDYLPSLLKYIDPENLPRYLGGTSDATLIDDAGPWNDPQIRAEIEEDMVHRDGGGSQTMSILPESPQAASSNASPVHSSAQPTVNNGRASFTRGYEAPAVSQGVLAYSMPAHPSSQHASPFAAQSQHTPFDTDTAQVCFPNCRMLLYCWLQALHINQAAQWHTALCRCV